LKFPKVQNAIFQKESPMLSDDILYRYHDIQYKLELIFQRNSQNQVDPISYQYLPRVSKRSILICSLFLQAFHCNVRSILDMLPFQFCQVFKDNSLIRLAWFHYQSWHPSHQIYLRTLLFLQYSGHETIIGLRQLRNPFKPTSHFSWLIHLMN